MTDQEVLERAAAILRKRLRLLNDADQNHTFTTREQLDTAAIICDIESEFATPKGN
jgi:hypothetical protein